MWVAIINSKIINNGLLRVNVSFSDGNQTFTENYETRSGQSEKWLSDNINRRLTDLISLDSFIETIPLGEFVYNAISSEGEDTPSDERALYEYRLNLFEKMVNSIRKGIITDQNPTFLNLKTWLKNNFVDDYIDLF